jgi:tetratricopeptide (TPR) repeat protein
MRTAAIASGLWLVHPLQTEAVTYIVQRAESLGVLFYLGSFYGFICYTKGRFSGAVISIVLLIAGVFTKEMVATAPILFVLYDYTFVTGSIKRAIEKRGVYYACTLTSWIAIAATSIVTHGRNGTVTFGTEIGPVSYALTEAWAILRYLELSVLPVGQIFPYEAKAVTDVDVIVPCLVAVTLLLAFSVYLMVKRPRLGFLLCSFFIILAPTSSFIPIVTETIAEHRMYLPLVICTTLAALLIVRLPLWATAAVSIAMLVTLAGATFVRNRVFVSPMSIWEDAESKQPNAEEIASNYAVELVHAGRVRDAEAVLRHSISKHPHNPIGLVNLANILGAQGKAAEAHRLYSLAMSEKPDFPEGLFNVGIALRQEGHLAEAEAVLRRAINLAPTFPEALNGLGTVLSQEGKAPAAREAYNRAVAADETYAEPHYNLGNADALLDDRETASNEYRQAITLNPNFPEAYNALAQIDVRIGDFQDAELKYKQALAQSPSFAEANYNLGNLYLAERRFDEAIKKFNNALSSKPSFPEAETNLGSSLLALGRLTESVIHLRKAIALQPQNRDAHHNLSLALRALGDEDGADHEERLSGDR